ncbi:MAG: D-sedoheptulose 7-phosphate isomerase [Burkholderiaceae bacterium]
MAAQLIRDSLSDTAGLFAKLATDDAMAQTITDIAERCIIALKSGNKILFAGNGGSAADSQHLAAELVGRFGYDRPGLAAIALTTDTSILTAVGNDYGYEQIFARQVQALGQTGDILIGYSTSGNSANVLAAFDAAHDIGITRVGMTGNKGGLICGKSDCLVEVPSPNTARIQEAHIAIGHIICDLIEQTLFPAGA